VAYSATELGKGLSERRRQIESTCVLGDLRAELKPFARRNNLLALSVVALDLTVFLSASFMAVASTNILLKAIFAALAGTMTSTLFVLAHDASHGSLTTGYRLNRFLARLLFLPSLHNYTLWRIQHNRLHHRTPNVKGINSWSPLSYQEYADLPQWKQILQRFYRCGAGFGVYYLIERWWKDKFIPSPRVGPRHRSRAWGDVGLLSSALLLWLCALFGLGREFGNGSGIAAIFWGFVIPFAIWNYLIGLTIFLHHTSPAVPWFDSVGSFTTHSDDELSVNVQYPRWYAWLSHNIMEHPAHHVNPLIPWYHLRSAQQRLIVLVGSRAQTATFGPRYLLSIVRTCKLYDYSTHQWLDFSGRPTSRQTEVGRSASGFHRPRVA
jgi:omega-6 fatty acid desaturase (delta-12 desaturase)